MSNSLDYARRRALALRMLSSGERFTRRAGSFLGQVVVDATPLTDKQADWFEQLVERSGLQDGEVQP